jgi:CheY-like chemotaxis protein
MRSFCGCTQPISWKRRVIASLKSGTLMPLSRCSKPATMCGFTDIQMPGAIDGMVLARQVHARWPNILLVITSGQKRPARTEIPDDGRFVAKPYDAQELLSQVNELMQKP